MRIRPTSRRPLLFAAALLATLAATWWASSLDEEAEVVSGPARGGTPAATPRRVSAPPGGMLAVRRAPWPEAGATLMQSPPPPPVAVEMPPPEAEIPPLPFRFIGALGEQGRRSVILLEGKEVRIVRAGERIDANYRVDRITPTRVEFTHLPTRQRQALDIADHEAQP
ncbi:hypothetical protein [Propionivibrio limicola]|uniref:hypothetical protein n=1 Tax=Propionivibrio limicola TaxID=167645 RepID=UPI0012925EA3|nr:hypothetical protein [Propionivibrio limicola]